VNERPAQPKLSRSKVSLGKLGRLGGMTLGKTRKHRGMVCEAVQCAVRPGAAAWDGV